MEKLFNIVPSLPRGFHYYPDFISEKEELSLVELIKTYPLRPMQFRGFEAKRKVMSFGYDYHFEKKNLTVGTAIPEEFGPLISSIGDRTGIPPKKFVKVLLTEYSPGSVINWHRDAHPFEIIAGISLLSDCTFKLRPYDKSKQTRAATKAFTVERRSLYLMEGEARNDWEHSIAPVKEQRYSVTIRTLRSSG